MKLLFLTDTQIRGNNPLNRTGSYVDDIEAKFKEAIQIGKDMLVDVYIHGGDFFDSPLVSLGIADRFIDLMEKSEKKWYVVRGNHDEIGHNPKLSGESMLDHTFRRSKMVSHLGSRCLDGGRVYLEGFDYYHGIEKDIKNNGLKPSDSSATGKKIAVVHGLISPERLPDYMMSVCSDDIDCGFDLVLVGHYHKEMGVYKNGETTYVGIGSMARMTIGIDDIHRRPNVLFIDTETPRMKIIPLESARDFREAFKLEDVEREREADSKIDEFISSLESTKVQGLNLRGVIEEIGSKSGFEPEVIKLVTDRIGEFESGQAVLK